ncbi:MAG: RNA polymerase sigma factor [bacterium]
MATNKKNTAKKYNLSVIMKRAWVIYRKSNGKLTWSNSLKQSWEIAKNGITTNDFSAIYKKYHDQVFYFVNGKLFGNTIIAEEITNDVFTKAYNHLENYDVMKAQLNTWLMTIAKNCVIDYSRSKQYKKSTHVDLIDGYVDETGKETYQIGCDMMDGQNNMENKELGASISKAFEGLNERDKELSMLFFMEQKTYEEIAELMDIPLGTVKGTLNRCRAKLQKKLQGVY